MPEPLAWARTPALCLLRQCGSGHCTPWVVGTTCRPIRDTAGSRAATGRRLPRWRPAMYAALLAFRGGSPSEVVVEAEAGLVLPCLWAG